MTAIWVSMTSTDLAASTAFYTALGYPVDPRFTDENAACFTVSPDIALMLLRREFFATLTEKVVADPRTHAQVGLNLTCDSRAQVDAAVERGLAAGGTEPQPAQDHGAMYARDLEDPDGNNIGFLYMDPDAG